MEQTTYEKWIKHLQGILMLSEHIWKIYKYVKLTLVHALS